MKKKAVVLLCLAMLMTILALPTFADDPTINVILDGQTLIFDVPPFINNGELLVPLRTTFEKMGANVTWDDAIFKRAISISTNGTGYVSAKSCR